MRTAFAAISLVALVVAAGSDARPALLGPGLLFSNGGTDVRRAPIRATGLYRLTPGGSVRAVLDDNVSPASIAATGETIGYAADPNDGRLYLVEGNRRVVLPHTEGMGWCPAISADGSSVAYVTGSGRYVQPSRHLLYTRIEGTLWVAATGSLEQARAVAVGAFAASECPQWSPAGNRLAYFVDRGVAGWELNVYRDGTVRAVETEETPVPSAHDRSFAWSRDGRLAFLRGRELYVGARRIGRRLLDRLAPRVTTVHNHAIAVSPSGRLVAASLGDRTGIFRIDGAVVRVTAGHLREWSGNRAVLTNPVDRLTPTLAWVPLRGSIRVLARHFKTPVVGDPGGAWFAYKATGTRQLVFRRADGSLLRTARLRFIPRVLEAVGADDRVREPPGSY